MKGIALVITAAAGLFVAGCGAAAKVQHSVGQQGGAIIFPRATTTTIPHPQTGQRIGCDIHGVAPSASVPSPGHRVTGSADGKSSSATINLTRKSDGSLAVSCTG